MKCFSCAVFMCSLFINTSLALAVFNEPDDDNGLKKTVIHDLRRESNIPYQEGDFPFQEDSLTELLRTEFCPEVKEVAQTQSFLITPPQPLNM